jgi:hypothetical protein
MTEQFELKAERDRYKAALERIAKAQTHGDLDWHSMVEAMAHIAREAITENRAEPQEGP